MNSMAALRLQWQVESSAALAEIPPVQELPKNLAQEPDSEAPPFTAGGEGSATEMSDEFGGGHTAKQGFKKGGEAMVGDDKTQGVFGGIDSLFTLELLSVLSPLALSLSERLPDLFLQLFLL